MNARAISVTEIGWKARRLLGIGSTAPAVVATLSRSVYLDVDGEIVWLGPPGSTLHGRALIAGAAVSFETGMRLDVAAAQQWRPPALPRGITADAMAHAARQLTRVLSRLGRPDGFGAVLAGEPPPFPLDRAADDATAFLAACGAGDAPGAAVLAERLLGLGPGLTPAGDDLVGGAFFARRALTDMGAVEAAPWRAAAATVHARAPERTHRISATLLGDLLEGDAYAPLHDLTVALTRGDGNAAIEAASRLICIGHSSGWDMLAGFLGALGASPPAR